MPWPLSQDYNEAIQNPIQCFADPELQQAEVVTNALGLPAPRSGNFADVYAVVTGERKWAVKCFNRQIPGLQERYQQISLHLKENKPSFLVDFTFLERGIQVRGEWFPILKMKWVEGFTLNQFVKDNLDKPQVLDVLSQLWVRLSVRLREANIAHCDLQHGNVLLVPGGKAGALHVSLVDYDGMCVPSLTLLKSIEVGHPAYQHPERQRVGIYSLEVDRFSHLVIYTALRALMTGGKTLWEKYDDGDNLLFKPSDFAAPTKSKLFYEILKSFGEEGRTLVGVMMQGLSGRIDRVALLEEVATPVSLVPKVLTKQDLAKSQTPAIGVLVPPEQGARLLSWVPKSSPHIQEPKVRKNRQRSAPADAGEAPGWWRSRGVAISLNVALVVLILVLVGVACFTVLERQRLAEAGTRNAAELSKVTALRQDAQDRLRLSEIKWQEADQKVQQAEEAPKRLKEYQRQAAEELRKAQDEVKASEETNSKARTTLREAEKKEHGVEMEKTQLAVDRKTLEEKKAVIQARIDEQEAKRRQNENTQQQLAKRERQLEETQRRADAKEKTLAETWKKILEIEKGFKRGLESSKAETRTAAALALARVDDPLLLPTVTYDLCAALVHETDVKVREHLVLCFKEVAPEICEPVKTLYFGLESADHPAQLRALENIRAHGSDGYGAAPALQWYLEQKMDMIKGSSGPYSSTGETERAMVVLALIAPGDPETVRGLCQSLKTTLPRPYSFSHYAFYQSALKSLSTVYEKNAPGRAPALAAMRIFLRHSEPKVVLLAAKILGALKPPPRELLPYVRETQETAVAAVGQALTELANKLEK